MEIPQRLLNWYSERKRDLPWRGTRDPYRIWISEIMLQQTQVKTVIPYYERFLVRFPTVVDLASASVEEVLALWSGLGYYRRARMLHRAAQVIAELDGRFPSSARELAKLPGIGAYTSAAIASIAFDEVVPVLDGNVERVLCRRLALEEDPRKAVGRRKLVEAASKLLDRVAPGDSNQALMELGATICRPKRPDCRICPVQSGCQAYLLDATERYPLVRSRRTIQRLDLAVAVVKREGRVLLFRRSEESELMPGLWELPTVDDRLESERIEGALGSRYGGRWMLSPATHAVRHSVTFRSLKLVVYPAFFEAGDSVAEGPEAAWVSSEECTDFPVSSMVYKILGRSW